MTAPRLVLDASVVLAAEAHLDDPLGLVLDLAAAAELVEVPVNLLPLDPFKGVRVLTPGDVPRRLRGQGRPGSG